MPTLAGRAYRCHCGNPIFFRNSKCLACGSPLGYDSALATLIPLMPGTMEDTWMQWQPEFPSNPSQTYTRCANLATPAACNWLVPLNDGQGVQLLCQACRLNRTIPDLNDPNHPDNGVLWGRIELAKRRLFSSLLALGLPVASLTEDPVRGISFDLLRSPDGGPPVTTGHKAGLITLNLQEADDAVREAVRNAMREPYRTLLGHFRHEIGHYYWDRLVNGTDWMQGFHLLFGDETLDYLTSLQKITPRGRPRSGGCVTLAPMPARIRGRTGLNAGRITCTCATPLIQPSVWGWRQTAPTWSSPPSRWMRCTGPSTQRPKHFWTF